MRLRVGGATINFNNLYELWCLYKDLFILKTYKFETTKKTPLIVDCGGHIGMSVIYFKKLYPSSKIIVFEPDPNNLTLLKKNVDDNKFKGVNIIGSALSDKEGYLKFYSTNKSKNLFNQSLWSWTNTAVKSPYLNPKDYNEIKVKSQRLVPFI